MCITSACSGLFQKGTLAEFVWGIIWKNCTTGLFRLIKIHFNQILVFLALGFTKMRCISTATKKHKTTTLKVNQSFELFVVLADPSMSGRFTHTEAHLHNRKLCPGSHPCCQTSSLQPVFLQATRWQLWTGTAAVSLCRQSGYVLPCRYRQ